MDVDTVYDLTGGRYMPINSAGRGTCGQTVFCITTPSPPSADVPDVAAVKVPREMRRLKLVQEIPVLKRIRCYTTASENRKHFTHILEYDPVTPGQGYKWLAVSAIHGFSLNQLLCTVQQSRLSTPPAKELFVPRVSVLHVAEQLINAVEWLHERVKVAHGDLWDADVMLQLSRNTNGLSIPDVVIIDFDNACLDPKSSSCGGDRAYTYGVINALARKAPEGSYEETEFFFDDKKGWDDCLE
jgi:serine/threonine protein kinase